MVRQAIQIALTNVPTWTGSVLLDPSFTEDGSPVYLRSFAFSVNPQMTFSPAAVGDSRADLRDEWETGDAAIEFEALDGTTLALRGPAHPDNAFSDDSEPYFWATNEGSGLVAFYNAHAGEAITLYLESGVNPTTDGPWSEPIGILTSDGPWSAILGGLDSTDGPWSNFVSQATTHGPWSIPLGLLTQDGPWSGFISSVTSDGPWSALLHTTIDGPWSALVAVNETLDGPWSDMLQGPGTVDGPWSQPIIQSGTQTGLAFLSSPVIPEDTLSEDSPGNYSVDIAWQGIPEHDSLHQGRIRWITREDKAGAPAPDHFMASQWPELDAAFVGLADGFEYRDTIIADPDMAPMGQVSLVDQILAQMGWAGQTVWVFARLEVEDGDKRNKVAAGTG